MIHGLGSIPFRGLGKVVRQGVGVIESERGVGMCRSNCRTTESRTIAICFTPLVIDVGIEGAVFPSRPERIRPLNRCTLGN